MMNRKEFYEYVKDNVKEYLPESYKDAEIKLQEVEKNNGLKLTGITIPNGDQRIVPTVYLDALYQEYINGKEVDSCVGDVADMRIEAQGKAEFFDMGVPDILDYEKMKDKLQMRICDKEWNTDLLADKVVTDHGVFVAYYAVNLEENGEGISSIPVTVSMMNEWGVSVEQIQADAMMADRKRGVTLMDMNEIIKSMIFGEEPENLLNEKMEHPINRGNKKVLIFSAFSDTAEYLYENVSRYIKDKYGLNTAVITGNIEGRTTIPGFKSTLNNVLTCFSPISKDRDVLMPENKTEIDILIATDCISEGQNLQDCDYLVNYDIHWNPVRIIQRFGRIDRIGSIYEYIQLVNFWPDMNLDEYINLKSRVETRMKISVMTSTGDDDPINPEE